MEQDPGRRREWCHCLLCPGHHTTPAEVGLGTSLKLAWLVFLEYPKFPFSFCKFICWSVSMIANAVNSRIGLRPFQQWFLVESSTHSFCDGLILGFWPLVSLFGICLSFVFGINSVLSLGRISNRGVLQEQFQKCSGWAEQSLFRLLNVSQVEDANFWFWNFLLWGLTQRSVSCLLHFTKESLSSFHLLCILEFLVTEYSVIKDPFVH